MYLSKIDIADGFYRIKVASRDVPKLGVLLPQEDDEEPMIALPLVLPMGWVNSPPYFSAATETAADIMNAQLGRHVVAPPHRLELVAATPPSDAATHQSQLVGSAIHPPHYRRPIQYADVYVDDFIGLSQGPPATRQNTLRILLHTLDMIFRPLTPLDHEARQEPASVKKCLKATPLGPLARWSSDG